MARAPRQPKKQQAAQQSKPTGDVYGPSIRTTTLQAGKRPTKGNVQHIHRELVAMLPTYALIMDCIRGEMAIKLHDSYFNNHTIYPMFNMPEFGEAALYNSCGAVYLPHYLLRPNPTDTSDTNRERYRDYVARAVFYNVTGHTLESFNGAIFLRLPVIEMPDELGVLSDDISGSGISLIQSAKASVNSTMAYGRAGVLVDFPAVDVPITRADKLAKRYRATITAYEPWAVINWRSKWIDGKQTPTLVVLAEPGLTEDDDDFQQGTTEQYRVLRLINGVYSVEIWRRNGLDGGGDGSLAVYKTYQPRDSAGQLFEYIPFKFIGAHDNTSKVDKAPMSDIAHLNIGHYRNSADYEESAYLCGQPTVAISGLTTEWANDVLGGKVMFGSRAALMLPEGAEAKIIQAEANGLANEAMLSKEAQMRALGAKLIDENRVQKTATEADHDEAASQSVLASSAANVSQAYLWALQQMCRFEGIAYTDETLKFELNTELDLTKPSPEARKQLYTEWQGQGITWLEYRNGLRRAGVATMDDDKAKADIAANPTAQATALAAAVTTTSTNDKVAP